MLKQSTRSSKTHVAAVKRSLTGDGLIPFTCTFPVRPQFRLPEDFKVSRYPGLLLCHTTLDGDASTVVAYWRDKPCSDAYLPSLRADLGLPEPDTAGLVRDIYTESPGPWRRLSPREMILGGAAILSAILGFRQDAYRLLEQPKTMVMFADASKPLDCVSGKTFSASATTASMTVFAQAIITVQPPEILWGKSAVHSDVQVDLPGFPALLAGQERTFTVFGTAPPGQTGPPREYKLRANISSHGFLHRDLTRLAERTLKVWSPKLEWTQNHVLASQPQPNQCLFRGFIYPDRRYRSARGECLFSAKQGQIRGLEFTINGRESDELPPPPPDKSGTVLFGRYGDTTELTAFDEMPYTITLAASKSATADECSVWGRNLNVSFRATEAGR